MKTPINEQWQELQQHAAYMKQQRISEMFAQNPQRNHQFSLDLSGLYFDYSKNFIDAETMRLLAAWANSMDLEDKIQQLFSNVVCNPSEARPALHWALRGHLEKLPQELQDEIIAAKRQASQIAKEIRQQRWLGYNGQAITDVLHIGIGGSVLGPEFLYTALRSGKKSDIKAHFISSNDPVALGETLAVLPAATTLVLLVSKSFRSSEVLENAQQVINWISDNAADSSAWQQQTIAITANKEAAMAFRVPEKNIVPLWDWLGGRFSISSAVSLCIEICYGSKVFAEFLSGQGAVDRHFLQEPLLQNIPVLQALISLWYNHFFNVSSEAVICYSQSLRMFPSYLQQLQMESLGKSVDLSGQEISYPTGAITWGGVGPQTQHSFHQLLMQGSHLVAIDFIAIKNNTQENNLGANAIAQAYTLMHGYHLENNLPFADVRQITGNKPSNFIMLEAINPFQLGQLISLYEHKVYVQSVMLNINAFDQWGVEIAKTVAKDLLDAAPGLSLDPSSAELWRKMQSSA